MELVEIIEIVQIAGEYLCKGLLIGMAICVMKTIQPAKKRIK